MKVDTISEAVRYLKSNPKSFVNCFIDDYEICLTICSTAASTQWIDGSRRTVSARRDFGIQHIKRPNESIFHPPLAAMHLLPMDTMDAFAPNEEIEKWAEKFMKCCIEIDEGSLFQ